MSERFSPNIIIFPIGIYLPDGTFIPRNGGGHAKTAIEICSKSPLLRKAMLNSPLKADEFVLCAGFAITAGYRGHRVFKIAKDNSFPALNAKKKEFEEFNDTVKLQTNTSNFENANIIEIWEYWQINNEWEQIAMKELGIMPK